MIANLSQVQQYIQRARAEYLLRDFKTFASESGLVLDYCAQPHDEMCLELEQCIPNLGKVEPDHIREKKLFLAPRGTFKTALLRTLLVYMILKFPTIRIVIARNKHEESKQTLAALQADFKKSFIVAVFGDIEKRAKSWNEEVIQIGDRQEPTVDTGALGISKTGNHVDFIMVDDIINDKNYRSPVVMADAKDVIMNYYPVMDPWSRMVVSGTRWTTADVYGWILKELAEDEKLGRKTSWTAYVRGPRLPDGSPYFPARLDEQQLQQLEWEYRSNRRLFAANYLNSPYDDQTRVFKDEYLVGKMFVADFYRTPFPCIEVRIEPDCDPTRPIFVTNSARQDYAVLQVPVETSMTIDPALTTNRRSDSTGVVTVACDHDGNWWVLIARGYKAVPSVISDRIMRWIEAFNPYVALIESAQADVGMVSRLKESLLEGGHRTEIKSYHVLRDEKKGERGKAARIEALEGLFVDGKIYLQVGACDDLIEQYQQWDGSESTHDDVLDALAMQRRVVIPSRHSTYEQAESGLEDEVEEYESPWEARAAQGDRKRKVIAPVGRSSLALRV